MMVKSAFWSASLCAAICLAAAAPAGAASGRGQAIGRAFSYAWNNPQQQPWDNPLQSSMYVNPPSWDYYGRPDRNRAMSSPMDSSIRSNYAPPSLSPMVVSPSVSGANLQPMVLTSVGSVRKAVSLLAKEDKTDEPLTGAWLTSLAPDSPGAVRQPMVDGEAAFRQGKYADAAASFEKARQASDSSPESLLALAHVYFAMGDKSYGPSASNLIKAIKAFPDLPLVRVRPADFFPSPEEYSKAYAALAAYVKANPRDGSALFLLGYMQWRQGLADAAFQTLDAAAKACDDKPTLDAIALLMSGMGQSVHEVLAQAPPMGERADYSWAGISLALPKTFAGNALTSLNRVLSGLAVGKEPDDAQLVTLNAYPLSDSVTLAAFMDSVIDSMRKAHFIKDVSIDGELDIPFRNGKAMVRMFSYAPIQGEGRIAASWFGFLREAKDKNGQPIAYLLGVAGSDKQDNLHLSTLAAIAKSLALAEPSAPGIPSLEGGHRIDDAKFRFAVVQPSGWAGQATDRGYEMGQMDFLRGHAFSPKVEVVVQPVLGSYTPKSFGEEFIRRQEKAGVTWQVVSESPTRLAEQDGHQFVLRQTAPASQPAAANGDMILVGRLICQPGPDGQKTLYALVVQQRGGDPAQVAGLVEKLSVGFTLSPEAAPGK